MCVFYTVFTHAVSVPLVWALQHILSMPVSLQKDSFDSLEYTLGIIESYSNSIFNSLRTLHTHFHSRWNNLTVYKGSCFPHINICIFLVTVILLFSTLINICFFLMIVTLIGLKWDLNVILICLSLMVNISFMYLLVICASSLRSICSIYCLFFSLFSYCLGFFIPTIMLI